jgi:hypothetical protein
MNCEAGSFLSRRSRGLPGRRRRSTRRSEPARAKPPGRRRRARFQAEGERADHTRLLTVAAVARPKTGDPNETVASSATAPEARATRVSALGSGRVVAVARDQPRADHRNRFSIPSWSGELLQAP